MWSTICHRIIFELLGRAKKAKEKSLCESKVRRYLFPSHEKNWLDELLCKNHSPRDTINVLFSEKDIHKRGWRKQSQSIHTHILCVFYLTRYFQPTVLSIPLQIVFLRLHDHFLKFYKPSRFNPVCRLTSVSFYTAETFYAIPRPG